MSDDKKLIAVVGASGAQGGSVVDALLADGKYKVRAGTRTPDSEKAKALAAKGAEVVKFDLNDETTLDAFFEGAYGAFAVTNPWDPASWGKEVAHGKAMADAAKKADVQHYVWSTLANVEEVSKGKYSVPHFTDKALVDAHLKEIGLPHTLFVAACYYQNFGGFLQPKKDDDGVLHFALNVGQDAPVAMFDVRDTGEYKPRFAGQVFIVHIALNVGQDAVVAMFDVRDTGAGVLAAFNDRENYLDEVIFMVGENRPFTQILGDEAAQEALGDKVVVDTVTLEQFAGLGFPGAKEMAHMWGWFDEFQYGGPKYTPLVDSGRKAHPKVKSFAEYAKDVGLKFTPQ